MTTTYANPAKVHFPPLLKMREVSKVLSLSRASVQALIDSGDLAASPLNPTRRKKQRVHLRITRSSLLEFYRKRFGHPLDLSLENSSHS